MQAPARPSSAPATSVTAVGDSCDGGGQSSHRRECRFFADDDDTAAAAAALPLSLSLGFVVLPSTSRCSRVYPPSPGLVMGDPYGQRYIRDSLAHCTPFFRRTR